MSIQNNIVSISLSNSKLRFGEWITKIFSENARYQVLSQFTFDSEHFSKFELNHLDCLCKASELIHCLLNHLNSILMLCHSALQSIKHFLLRVFCFKHVSLDQSWNTSLANLESFSDIGICDIVLKLEFGDLVQVVDESSRVRTSSSSHLLSDVDIHNLLHIWFILRVDPSSICNCILLHLFIRHENRMQTSFPRAYMRPLILFELSSFELIPRVDLSSYHFDLTFIDLDIREYPSLGFGVFGVFGFGVLGLLGQTFYNGY